ncbi:uncharacterized protein C8Q71DRAFT_757305 [Rhodofomes roseus]|uniref:DUF6534 domain-containing protein n=1 Tax=Rhodofomes roseus TaxID=34475 RepID=A0ABQ8KHC4_9APHY|nr:uncharacterized protein C8Q71DRAFT_757305 [Rhodofomes roseus]KAH9837233.1 hypothetical protein C8Q71DRAFT_757305 [Rhodofomes roseus]
MVGVNLHLNDTMGCTFIGVLFALGLYGASCAQTIFYYHEYPKDHIRLKALVAILWLLDTASTILDICFLWYWLITYHSDTGGLSVLPDAFTAEFFLASLTVCIVQCYFISTIWRLLASKWFQWPLTSIMIFLAAASFVGGIVTVYRINLNTQATAAVVASTVPASIQTVTAFVADAYITTSLCVILWGRKTGFKRTEVLITTLIVYAIHRGIFTGLIQLAHFTTYISTIHSDSLYWMLWHIPGSKIYVNSLLAVLNVRHQLREGPPEAEYSLDVFSLDSTPGQSVSVSRRRSRATLNKTTQSRTHIMLTREVVRDDGERTRVPSPINETDVGDKVPYS